MNAVNTDRTKVKWGIVSAGRIANQFCTDFNLVDNGEIVAVAARNMSNAKDFARTYGIPKAYQGYQALFEDADIEAVYIATPHTSHYQNVKDALNAGKHVLCEKPFTVSSEQCIELTDLAKSKGLFLMEAMWTYFLPALVKAKQWVDKGRIGKLKHIKCDFGYPLPFDANSREYDPQLAGGCLLEMGIYPIAIAQYFSGASLTDLHVRAHHAPNGVEDDVIITAKSGAVMSSLATSFQCRLRNSAYIIGDNGYIVIPDAFRASECMFYQIDQLISHYQDHRKSLGFNFETSHVNQLILSGEIESPVVSHQHSLDFQLQMEAIKAKFSL